jgi:mono/diheme cytochrome c family protein
MFRRVSAEEDAAARFFSDFIFPGKFDFMDRKILIGIIAAAAVAAVFIFAPRPSRPPERTVAAAGPGAEESKGQALFQKSCMECHGPGAQGSDKGPPLVHRYYEPNHHGDIAFYLAAGRGVRQHHWKFGDMKPVGGLSRDDVTLIIRYVRGLQRKAGIF